MAVTDIVKKALEGFQNNANANSNEEKPPSTSQLFVLTVVMQKVSASLPLKLCKLGHRSLQSRQAA